MLVSYRGSAGTCSSRRLACLDDKGRAAVVLDTGAVTRGSGSKNEDKERNIRKWFVDQDLIDGVILLPENLFYNTTAAGVIMVLNKRKPRLQRYDIVFNNTNTKELVGKCALWDHEST